MTSANDLLSVDSDRSKVDRETANVKGEGQANGITSGSQGAKEKATPNRILRYAEV